MGILVDQGQTHLRTAARVLTRPRRIRGLLRNIASLAEIEKTERWLFHAALERSTLHSHVHTERRAAVVVALRSNRRDGVVPHPCWFLVFGLLCASGYERTSVKVARVAAGQCMARVQGLANDHCVVFARVVTRLVVGAIVPGELLSGRDGGGRHEAVRRVLALAVDVGERRDVELQYVQFATCDGRWVR